MQIDNSDIEAKVLLRRSAMGLLARPVRVLDLFAGAGAMFREIWKEADDYLGIDKRFSRLREDGLCWHGDNLKLLLHAMKEAKWNVFDLDAYNNPWILARKLLPLIRCNTFIMTLTCGIGRGLKNGKTNGHIRKVSGTNGLSDTRLLYRWYDDIVRWIITDFLTVRSFQVDVLRRIRPLKKNDVCYWLLKGRFE